MLGNFLILVFNIYIVEKDSKWSQKNRNIFLCRQAFAAKHDSFLISEGNVYPSNFFWMFIFIILLIIINE